MLALPPSHAYPLHDLSSIPPCLQRQLNREGLADSSNKPFPWGMQSLFFNPEVNVPAE